MIKNIELHNFKSFIHERIEFSNLNIITGINSSGKSTIINAINAPCHLDKDSKRLSINGDHFSLGSVKDIYCNFNNDDELFITYGLITSGTESTFKLSVQEPEKNLESDFPKVDIEGNLEEIAYCKKYLKYISAERIGAEFIYNSDSTEFESDEWSLGSKGQNAVSFLNSHGGKNLPIEKLKNPNLLNHAGKSSSIISNVNAWMQDISPGVNLDFKKDLNLRAASMSASYYSNSLISNLTPKNIGFGISYVLPIITALLSSSANTILCIENPEAHIHPKGQTKLGYLTAIAAANGVQIFVETHSDHFFNGVRLAVKDGVIGTDETNTLYIAKELSGTGSTQTLSSKIHKVELFDDGKIRHAPKDFFDEWESSLFKLL
ncbi:hypothetical protein A9Q99_02285 [Gammaproteobacteria bacterium 45_16_T64]|nr:hypothetical protein A9Q99_02285 [Gammaproteobacteria bacterium 45_16_T64]